MYSVARVHRLGAPVLTSATRGKGLGLSGTSRAGLSLHRGDPSFQHTAARALSTTGVRDAIRKSQQPQRPASTTPEKWKNVSFWKKAKSVGLVGFVTYYGVYYTSWVAIWALLESGVDVAGMFGYNAADSIEIMMGVERWCTGDVAICAMLFGEVPSDSVGNFAIAYCINKPAELYRMPATFLLAPTVAKILGRPVPPFFQRKKKKEEE